MEIAKSRRRSRRILIIAFIASATAAGALGPAVFRRARVAWWASRIESPDEKTRWAARSALLQRPRDEIAHVLPRIVAATVIDCANDARDPNIFCVERRDDDAEIVGSMYRWIELVRVSVREVLHVSRSGQRGPVAEREVTPPSGSELVLNLDRGVTHNDREIVLSILGNAVHANERAVALVRLIPPMHDSRDFGEETLLLAPLDDEALELIRSRLAERAP